MIPRLIERARNVKHLGMLEFPNVFQLCVILLNVGHHIYFECLNHPGDGAGRSFDALIIEIGLEQAPFVFSHI
jgi:hypothetical protein